MRMARPRLVVSAVLLILIVLLPTQSPLLERIMNPLNGPLTSFIGGETLDRAVVGGLRSSVEILYDELGIPWIYAGDRLDAARALGFIHARDRLFQMDLMRRLAQGRLSELLGEATLESDKRFRLMGLHIASRETWEYIRDTPEYGLEASVLEAYTEGVNSYIELALERGLLPTEYRLLDAEPEPWTPVDSLSIGKFMAWSLSWSMEDLYLADLVDRYGLEILIDLDILGRRLNTPILEEFGVDGVGGETLSSNTPSYNASGIVGLLSWLEEYRGLIGIGSNNWVVSGSLTVDGRPIVANDPHLALTAPPIWYVVVIRIGDEWSLTGFTLPGTPVILLGRNQYVAWGFTNVGPDVTDYYFFKWRGDEYLFNGEWLPLERRVEEIRVREGDGYRVVEYPVNMTVLGPLMEHGGARYAMAWTGSGVTLELVAVYRYNFARSIWDLIEAARYFHVAPQNLVAADVEGNILYYPAGKYPLRRPVSLGMARGIEIVNHGFLPFNGSRGEGLWTGYIPFEEIPHAVNPEEGYIATANNKVVGSYPYYLGWSWSDRYRYERIVQLIESLKPLDIEDVMRIQVDRVSYAAEVFTELFGEILGPDELPEPYRSTYNSLLEWDHEMDPDSREASVYVLTLINLHRRLWGDVLRDIPINFFSAEWTEMVLREYIAGGGPSLDYVLDPREALVTAFREAVDRLLEEYGELPRWGEVIRYEIRHPLGDVVQWLNYRVYPGQGGLFTVFVSGHGFGDPPYRISASQSMRAIYPLDGSVKMYFALPGGNSGNPFSPHYEDLLPGYVDREFKAIDAGREPREVRSLWLEPSG